MRRRQNGLLMGLDRGRVAIVGLGLMGTSLALALRRARPDLEIVGVEPDPSHRQQAAALVERLPCFSDPERVAGCQVVFLAVPIAALRSVMAALAPVTGTSVVTDLASVKAGPLRWAAEAGMPLVGGHPMCGRELSGPGAAAADIFAGAPWILTRRSPEVEDLVQAAGSVPVHLSAEVHDRLVGGVSHLAFAASAAYMLALGESGRWPEMAPLASTGFRDVSRLAAGDAAMYASIGSANGSELAAWIDALQAQLERLRDLVAAGDEAGLRRFFEAAASARQEWRMGERVGTARP